MATRTITNTDYISAITVPGDVTVDTVDAKTGTFSDSVTAPTGTFTDIRANTASFDEIKDHIRTVDSIIELDTGNTGNSRTSGVVAKYVSGAETKHAGLLRGTGGGFHLVDDNQLPDVDTDPATLAKADLTVKQLSTAGSVLPLTTGTYDLGSSTRQFRGLYLANTTGNNTGHVHLGVNTIMANSAQLFLHSPGDGSRHIYFGRDATNSDNSLWSFSSRPAAEGNTFHLFRGPYLNGSGTQSIWTVTGSNGYFRFRLDNDATDSATAPVTYAGGVGIAKKLFVGSSITAGGSILPSTTGTLDLGSSSARFRDLYLGRSNGVINLGVNSSGDAGFTMTASGDKYATMVFGRSDAGTKWALSSRISTQHNNLKFIRGAALTGDAEESIIDIIGTGSDAGQTLFSKETDSASTTTGAVVVKGGVGIAKNLHVGSSITAGSLTTTGAITSGGHILPSTAATTDLGSSTRGFRKLLLQEGTGRIGLGWSIRVTSQAELHLNSSSDARSEITFGNGNIARANCKWAFNSFGSAEGNHFSLMRGPALTGDDTWQYIYHVDGSTGQFRYNVDTESNSTTTGAVTVAGGVGIAKNLHVGGTITAGTISASNIEVTGGTFHMNSTRRRVLIGPGAAPLVPTAFYQGEDLTVMGSNILTNYADANSAAIVAIGTNIMTAGTGATMLQPNLAGTVAIGTGTLRYHLGNPNGRPVVAVGRSALNSSIDVHSTVAVGFSALSNMTTHGNVTAVGYLAGSPGLPRDSVLIGDWAGSGVHQQAYQHNVAVGSSAMRNVTTGGQNVATGNSTLLALTTGTNNVAVGHQAGNTLTTGTNNVVVGHNAQVSQATGTNRIAIGAGVTSGKNNSAVIGNGSVTEVVFGHNNSATAGAGSASLGSETNPVRGIYLASPNGTPALLDRYERFNVITTLTGPWNDPKPITIKVTVIGSQVFINVDTLVVTTEKSANVISTPAGTIPARLCPQNVANDTASFIRALNGGALEMVYVSINSTGTFSVYTGLDPLGSLWNHNGAYSVTGWNRIDFSYTLD